MTQPLIQNMIGPKFTLTVGSSGILFKLGDLDPSHFLTGGVSLDFVPDQFWSGSIEFKARSAIKDASDDQAPFVGPWPFRAFYLNGVASDGSMVSGVSAPIITTFSSILVPTSGKLVALIASVSTGSCAVYIQPVQGTTIP